MAATASIAASMASLVPAPTGTANDTRQALDAAAVVTAETDTIAQISVMPDDGITGDEQLVQIRLLAVPQSATPDFTASEFTVTAHGYDQGQEVQLGGTTVPTGLAFGVTYYAVVLDADTFSLATTVGGAALPFSDNGSGVTVTAFGRAALGYMYPSTGPAVPVQIKDGVNGTPDDFSKIRALQIILRPLDIEADALGTVQLTSGDPSERPEYFAIPLHIDWEVGDEEVWPSWVASLPEGIVYNTDWHMELRTLHDEANVNLLVLINLLGN